MPHTPFTLAAFQAARNSKHPATPQPLISASQEPLDGQMTVIWGELPTDINGHTFFLIPNGSPNGTYPIPENIGDETNPEYGANVLAGNGYVLRLDFNQPGKAGMKARLLKAPSWYADEALAFNSNESEMLELATKTQKRASLALKLFKGYEKVEHIIEDVIVDGVVDWFTGENKAKENVKPETLDKLTTEEAVAYIKAKVEGKPVSDELSQEVEETITKSVQGMLEDVVHSQAGSVENIFHELFGMTFGFNYGGLSRFSGMLGISSLLNTAFTPVNFSGTSGAHQLLATSDTGRHWYINPTNLTLAAPIANLTDHLLSSGAFPPWPFPIIAGTAHPVFDPHTREYFGFNYKQPIHTSSQPRWTLFFALLAKDDPSLRSDIANFIAQDIKPLIADIDLNNLEEAIPALSGMAQTISTKFLNQLESTLSSNAATGQDIYKHHTTSLYRHTGTAGRRHRV